MRWKIVSILAVYFFLTSCQKEIITFGRGVSETFYVDNNKASMRVLVEGNTASKVFLLFVPGGPGTGSFIYETDYIRTYIEDHFAMVYWDERNAGASQGESNSDCLNLDQMTDDLKKVIRVINERYGQNCSIFILGHSFGGLLTSSFMISGDNQNLVKGWIFADASHNYPLNDTLTRQMLLTTGQHEISLNRNIKHWSGIVAYCNEHPGNFSYDESVQLETYAADAENYISNVVRVDLWSIIRKNAIKYHWPLTSMFVNYRYSSNAAINKDLGKLEFSSSLYKVKTPVLILFGFFDFICPKGLGEDLFNKIGSPDKKMIISPISGHSIMFQDEGLFCSAVDSFIILHR